MLLALATTTETSHTADKLSREGKASAERAWIAMNVAKNGFHAVCPVCTTAGHTYTCMEMAGKSKDDDVTWRRCSSWSKNEGEGCLALPPTYYSLH